ncbi:hypothetical protein H0H93_000257 [Arthromyces matolae]|nr:hypothetical protein H0H93_000257 [Arthromyces matolae]
MLERQPRRLFLVKNILFLLVDTGGVYGALQLVSSLSGFVLPNKTASGYVVELIFSNIYYSVSASIIELLPLKLLTAQAR